ncbi:Alpha-glucoside transport system permease protein AglF [Candidatus Promineifilum breve]|uniref:Alpha-glucoside transport system permease protein AglF n=1 Tax=Candidatus Promineifilum breve TaxID=1806508 RepID=A0A160T2C7_9CHLR|nr:sugar ABC transporter permease [Candidatus Promineifilum breve]CUS02725.2 Alpha-glucoside transport system permease protein AglF [Candidatus Promineifilum breve]
MRTDTSQAQPGLLTRLLTWLLRIALPVAILAIAFLVMYLGFDFLRAGSAPKWLVVIVAIIWGVGGVAALYWLFNWIVERMGDEWRGRLQPFVFVGPAVAMLIWFLAFPVLRTFWISLFNRDGPPDGWLNWGDLGGSFAALGERFVGLNNYVAVFTDRLMLEAFRNNVMWIVFGATITVIIGLLIAVLADRSSFERLGKSAIFLPMAISFVGAGVIWNFVYEVRPVNAEQIGLLNAIVVNLGGQPQPWPAWTAISPWNNLFLIVIVIWLQVGYAMVLFSAALKGIPADLMEAGRVDGANEIQIFFRIMIPYIMGTIITVSTTVLIFTLKIFDVVWVMTGGQFGTDVIATQFYRQSFIARNSGYGSAIAVVLLIAIVPVMIYNLKQFREQEAF